MDPKEFLLTLWRYKLAIGVCLILCLIGSVLALKRMKPIYEATAQILIVQNDPTLRNLFEDRVAEHAPSYARDSNPISTNSELLKTKPLLNATIRDVGLVDRKTGEPMAAGEFSQALKIQALKGTDLIRVSFQHPDPELAARVVNTLCQRFASENVENSRREASETLSFLEAQIAAIRKTLTRNDGELQHFKQANANFDIKVELESASLGLNQLNRMMGEAQIATRASRAQVQALSHKLGLDPEATLAVLTIGTHPTMARLQAQLVEARTKPILSSGLSPRHPDVQAARGQVSRLEELIRSEAQRIGGQTMRKLELGTLDPERERLSRMLIEEHVALIASEAKAAALGQEARRYRGLVERLPVIEQTLVKLNREREFNTETYKELLKRREQARVVHAMNIGNVRIVQPADTPRVPVKPNPRLTVMGAAAFGLMLGVGLALGLDALNDTLRDERRTRDVLGKVPLSGRLPIRRWLGPGREAPEVLLSDPLAPQELHEAYALLKLDLARSLGPRFRLLFAGVDAVDISTIVANLALSFAQNGRRVLLVDGNLREPTLHRIFPAEHDRGLKDLLAGEVSWEDAASKVEGLPLWVITADAGVQSPLDLLDSPRMWTLGETLGNFDVVLGLAPPVTRALDAVALSRLFGVLWLVLDQRKTTRKELARSLALLAEREQLIAGSLFVHGSAA